MILFSILLSLIFNIIYFIISQKMRISLFYQYFIGFILYTIIVFYFLLFINLQFNSNEWTSFLSMYLLFFISLFLTMSVKYIRSPSYLIFKFLKSKKNKKEIIKYLENQRVLKKRFDDLISQNIIMIKKNKVYLKKNFFFFIKLIYLMKNFFKLRSEG